MAKQSYETEDGMTVCVEPGEEAGSSILSILADGAEVSHASTTILDRNAALFLAAGLMHNATMDLEEEGEN